jgi:hypothetical protein
MHLLLMLLSTLLAMAAAPGPASRSLADEKPQAKPVQKPAGITVAVDGVASAVIVVDERESAPVLTAAAELKKFLDQITGANIPIVSPANAPKRETGAPRLLVGTRAYVWSWAERNTSIDLAVPSSEGFVLGIDGPDLYIYGGEPRGTLYGVYTLLADELGCRWWTPTASTIPKSPTLNISLPKKDPELNREQAPAFEYRDIYYMDVFDPDWAVRNRTNGSRTKLTPEKGGNLRHVILAHSFYRVLPPEKYFAPNPEWYSLIDGKRTSDKAQLCLTNPQMLEAFIANTRELLAAKPGFNAISISQNDWAGQCQCGPCAAIDAEEKSPSGNILRFVNSVAGRLKPEFPGVTFTTLAYEYSVAPPVITRPADNVAVFVCTIRAGFEKPIVDQPTRPIAGQLREWCKIAARVWVWDYLPNFNHISLAHPNLHVLGPNIRLYQEIGVKGVFSQGVFNTPGAEFAELRSWVVAQLLWNPRQDDKALVREFVKGYYRKAAPGVLALIELNQKAIDGYDGKLSVYSRPHEKYLTLQLWLDSWAAVEQALKLAEGDDEVQQRLVSVRLPLIYQRLARWGDFQKQARAKSITLPGPSTAQEAGELFIRLAKSIQLSRTGENKPGYDRIQEFIEKANQAEKETAAKPAESTAAE